MGEARGKLELGLHFESRDHAVNAALLDGFARCMVEVKATLGPQWEAEQWDRGWAKVYETLPYEPFSDETLQADLWMVPLDGSARKTGTFRALRSQGFEQASAVTQLTVLPFIKAETAACMPDILALPTLRRGGQDKRAYFLTFTSAGNREWCPSPCLSAAQQRFCQDCAINSGESDLYGR